MRLKDAAKAHIEAYDAIFEEHILDNLVANIPPLIRGKTKIVVEDIHIYPPFLSDKDHISVDRRLFPWECRERGLTYKGKIIIRISLFHDNKHIMTEDKLAGYFPIMVRSSLCHLRNAKNMNKVGEDEDEVGGYFIINGFDKFIRFTITQKRNHIFAFKTRKRESFFTGYGVSMRCVGKDEIGHMNNLYYCTDGNVVLKMYYRRSEFFFPLVLILRALVNTTDEELYEALGQGERAIHLLKCFAEYNVFSRKECLDYIGSRFSSMANFGSKIEVAEEILSKYIASHLSSHLDKFNFLILAAKKLFSFVNNEIAEEDFDSSGNHELHTTTQILSSLLRDKIEEFMRSLPIAYKKAYLKSEGEKRRLEEDSDSEVVDGIYEDKLDILKIKEIFKKAVMNIGQKVELFLSSGNIFLSCCSDILQTTGLSITLERTNFYRYFGNLRSINRGTHIPSLVTRIRKLRPESWGFICPVHTPDGACCGVLLHMAKGADIVSRANDFDTEILFELGVVPTIRGVRMEVPVLVDGKVIGSTSSPQFLVRMLREYKVKNRLKIEIVYSEGTKVFSSVCIFSSMGRFIRKVMNQRLGSEEWVGIMEQVSLNIDLERGEGDYHEIDKSNILGIIAGLTPYSEHNQSPRNMYQCQMAKQAMGFSAYNMKTRIDHTMYNINYLQSPLVRTKGYDMVKDYPLGINCMVAVLSYTAYDMEDALVINKSSIERGLFTGLIYKTERIVLNKGYSFLYLPSVGEKIQKDSILYKYVDLEDREYQTRYLETEDGVIDSVRVFESDAGERCALLTIRMVRNPTIGDKFSSRHGQKGVCSVHWPSIDMPFTESGYVPDIIINPHAFPSRMTIGMLMESIAGKVGCLSGNTQDGTAFEKNLSQGEDEETVGRKEYICSELQKYGFNYYGNEPMYSGVSGNEFRVDVFVGVVYYQRLKHMVGDKFQVRTKGAIVSTTRQPVGGRKRQGGIRFGEMERDTLISHGASHLLQDRLLKCSDGTTFEYCGACKSILFTSSGDCICGSSDIRIVEMPYVFKYLCYELLAMNIRVKLDL
ncbi:DNA-directed RNA polymerase subunit B [Encephalitozoon intestinalis ATCC 50506]|uniref:DNA-directed RNA polymerase subunit beta n=1 Tax=Encephalitozoon intestinalis (strain ATCC 50506) TaxID=876142 RepID=E0S645_ENCIT|nr:DNA-directed RNA polymerase subunit B [Encephalitozoon intestinalis ATCC 50506]ADM11180.1 DNA-directed RNA polymerase subunit B [Encephalitozoon intestinalis ATCC 50506]UTX44847.1 DNA-directed RNA polymerase I subunit RPA135 [Encephalitozoon intestinalis]